MVINTFNWKIVKIIKVLLCHLTLSGDKFHPFFDSGAWFRSCGVSYVAYGINCCVGDPWGRPEHRGSRTEMSVALNGPKQQKAHADLDGGAWFLNLGDTTSGG